MASNEITNVKIDCFTADGKKCATAYVYYENEKIGKMTACYSRDADEQMCVYCGCINTEDPGEGPYDEFENRHEAIVSEFGDVFEVVFDVVERIIA